MEISHPAEHLGAIVTGIDVTRLDDEGFSVLYRTWLERGVLCVRGQDLDMPGYLAWCRRFGRVKPHLVSRTRHARYPELTVMGVDKLNPDGTPKLEILKRGVGWHTDLPWDQEVCKGTQLYAAAVPGRGGDTLFTCMYLAWERLPQGLKARVRGRKAEFVYGGRAKARNALLSGDEEGRVPAVHPIERVHEETGRTSLYLNPYHVLRIHDCPAQESDALLEDLTPHMVVDGAGYRHAWQRGDIVIWDNRCTMHSATGDYPIEEDRIHWRATIMHDAPAGGPGAPAPEAARTR